MTNSELAATAWNAARHSDDAPWANLSVVMKGKLIALAGKYAGGAKVDEGDYPPEGFAQKVWELAAGADISVGEPIVFIDSPPLMIPSGMSFAEHEDLRIPSPIPEDVDPLRLIAEGGAVVELYPKPEEPPLQGTIAVETDEKGKTSATVNVVSRRHAKKSATSVKKKATTKKLAKKPSPKK